MSETKQYFPGKELDRLVAERLGHKVIPATRTYYSTIQIQLNGDKYMIELPNYSTEMGAAWELIEYTISKGYANTFAYMPIGGGMRWFAIFQKKELFLCPQYKSEADTAPLAVCKAFLALPDEVKE